MSKPKIVRLQLPSGNWIEKRMVRGSVSYFCGGVRYDSSEWVVPEYTTGSDLWTLAERCEAYRDAEAALFADASLRAEARLETMRCAASTDGACALRCRPHWNCSAECGPHVAVDEDGCCSTCGADAVPINAAGECDLCGAGIENGDWHNEGCDHYRASLGVETK